MDDRERLRRDEMLVGELLESGQDLQRLTPSPGHSIRVAQPRVGPALSATRPLFESLQRPWPVAFSFVGQGHGLVRAGEFRIDLQGLPELLDRLVVPAQAYQGHPQLRVDDEG